jgi:hypothetical protein
MYIAFEAELSIVWCCTTFPTFNFAMNIPAIVLKSVSSVYQTAYV